MGIFDETAFALWQKLEQKELSSEELTRSYLDRIAETDPKINAYITVTGEQALKKAREIDARRASGEVLPPLAGIPYGLKDLLCTKGIRTTAASKMLGSFVPPYSAHVYEQLEKNGAIMLGKTNLDEFAMGSANEHSAFGPVRNPHDLSRIPGGSSGGSAAAVAAGEAVFSIGTDTGGSIRQPASHCGVVGLRPTYGTVSRFGVIAFASSLDQVGPITKDVRDCALVLNAIAGHDRRDATSMDIAYPDYTGALGRDIRGLRIGLPKEYFGPAIDEEVRSFVLAAAKRYESLGAEIVECGLPMMGYALAAYYIVSSAEAASNLARYDGVEFGYRAKAARDPMELYLRSRSEGFGNEVKIRILLGTYVLSSGYYDAYYKKAQKARTLIRQDFDRAFEKADALLTPVSPSVAWELGKNQSPEQVYASDVCTVSVNAAGLCALSLPCGKSREGLPIGMQLIGKPLDEPTLLSAAYAYECERGRI
ncbi:MAG: Asp-tRNA(Asn)/Glu-tRNA(Gln) amidotransferase subunit GatA [Bacillota bacterium]